MQTYTVVPSDSHDPSVPGPMPLVRFLERFDPGSVRLTTLAELLKGDSIHTDLLFLTLPTSFSRAHLARVKARAIVLLDYFDSPVPHWKGSDETFLRSTSSLYLKVNLLQTLDTGMRMGLLPIELPSRLGRAYRRRRLWSPLTRLAEKLGRAERCWDVSLLGSATYLDDHLPDGTHFRYHQRIEWLREVRAQAGWRFWGGLYELPYFRVDHIEAECGSVRQLLEGTERLHHRTFFSRMGRTRVALCPLGHGRWTYRHFESIYAGCDVVSCDVSQIRTLPPLPTECFEQVPDHAPIAPYVERALAQWPQNQSRRDAALQACEKYLLDGSYSRRRPLPFDLFRGQFD
jgi:hypothetical protein